MADFRKYFESMEKIKVLKTQELIHEAEQEGRIGFTPQDEIALRHEIVIPDQFTGINTKSMRIANLTPMETIAVKKAGMLVTWLDSKRGSEGYNGDEMNAFIREIQRDVNLLLNVSVSRKGWLLDNILSPKKRFTLGNEMTERKGIFQPKEQGG
jgi:hypothetical protein